MSLAILAFHFIVLLLGFAYAKAYGKRSMLARLNWDDLLIELHPVSTEEISTIALDYLHPRKGEVRIPPEAFWEMIGKAEGLRKMYANAGVLIALAAYAQRWNRTESLVVAERMRRDGIILRRATLRLSLGLVLGYDRIYGPFSVQEAATAYYLMTERVLALYEMSHAGRLPRLAAVV